MRNPVYLLLLLSASAASLPAQINIDRGTVKVNLTYGGQPATQAAPGFYLSISFGSYAQGMFYDSYTFNDVIPGAYSAQVRLSPSNAVLATYPITVTGGQQTVLNIEMNTFAGIYFGKLLVNGQPGGGYTSCPATGLGCIATDGAGVFKHLVAAGAGSGFINGSNGQILTYNFTVTAGQAVDLGTLNYSIGSVKVNLKYGGQPATQAAPGFYVTVSFGSYAQGMFYDSYLFPQVQPGSYSMQVRVSPSNAVLATIPLTVSAGNETPVDIELSAFAGVYFGTLLVNGQPGSGYTSCPSTGLGCIGTGGTGVFKHIAAAGTGSGFINGSNGQILTYNFTVAAGQTVDLGTFNYGIGSVRVNLRYGGQSATAAAPGFYVTVTFGNYSQGMFYDTYTFPQVQPGSYSMQVRVSPSNAVLQTIPVTVSAGNESVADIDLCGIAGVIRGTLTVNGVPANGYTSCPSTGLGCIGVNAGVFSHIVAAGPGTGLIYGPNGVAWYYGYKANACAQSSIGDPTNLNVVAARQTPTGTMASRVWPVKFTNYGAGPLALNVTNFQLTHISGPVCTPAIQSPVSHPLGTLQPLASTTHNYSISFSGCGATSRFRLNISVNDGANTVALPAVFHFY